MEIINKTLDIGMDKIGKIIHISDIHIRNLKRHTEYRSLFKKLYKQCREIKEEYPDAIIYLGGDIVHAKTDMSPELVDLVQEFFKTMAEIAPTILIAGNHDCNLNNESRMDALTPVVKAVEHAGFHYLRDSGVYDICGIKFIVWSVFDYDTAIIDPEDVEGEYKIVLFHGPVNNSETDYGFQLTGNRIKVEDFKGCDLGLLGDIHKFQYLNKDKTIAYPGSLIQQNHAESIENHGLILWDIETKKSEFIEVKNDWGYITIEIDSGQMPLITDLPSRPRIRIKYSDTNHTELKKLLVELKKKYKVQDIVLHRVDSIASEKSGDRETYISLGNIRDINYQNQLITDYLDRQFGIDDSIVDRIHKINSNINQQLPQSEIIRNIVWNPVKFDFSNMFSYGDDNYIDFTNMKGSYGMFAPNAAGKSSLLDALTFCCFDKCNRTNRGADVLNNKKESFYCKFQFEIGEVNYFIERRGKESRKGNFRIDVDFWCIDEYGRKRSLNGEQRKDTNQIIKSYLGSYDDFILTTLSLQNNNTSFIDKSQKERKELLAQFLDINIFDNLYDHAAAEIREINTLVKEYREKDHSDGIIEINRNVQQLSFKISHLMKDKKKHTSEVNSLESIIKGFHSKIIPLEEELPAIDDLIKEENEIKEKAESLGEKYRELTDLYKVSRELYEKDKKEYEEIDHGEIINGTEKLEELETEIATIRESLKLLKLEINHKISKLDRLGKHKYDPDCKYCMDNVFVKDALKTKEKLKEDKIRVIDIKRKESDLQGEIEELGGYKNMLTDYLERKSKFYESENGIFKLKNKITEKRLGIERINTRSTTIATNINLYYKQEDDIKFNKHVQEKIETHSSKLETEKGELEIVNEAIVGINSELSVLKNRKDLIYKDIDKLKNYEEEYEAYEYYIDAVKRDGIPYELISKAIPRIESEINDILTGLVDFNIVLNTDGKNINAYIAYDENNYWPLELTSGMEKFISSLAIRTALVSITSLPRPNFIAIDEGFGTLDTDNINSIFMLFNYLKSRFEFFITISHLDTMRDLVDRLVEIRKEKDYSKIQFSE